MLKILRHYSAQMKDEFGMVRELSHIKEQTTRIKKNSKPNPVKNRMMGKEKIAVREIIGHQLSVELEIPLAREEVIRVATEQEQFLVVSRDGQMKVGTIPRRCR